MNTTVHIHNNCFLQPPCECLEPQATTPNSVCENNWKINKCLKIKKNKKCFKEVNKKNCQAICEQCTPTCPNPGDVWSTKQCAKVLNKNKCGKVSGYNKCFKTCGYCE